MPISHAKYIGFLGKRFRLWCASKISDNISENANIEKGAVIVPGVAVGDNSGVGINCQLSTKTMIGDNVMMGPDCLFYSSSHRFDEEKLKFEGFNPPKPIVVENDVWIGARCIIMGGVTIGQGSIVGAGSVVTKDVPPYSLVAGNPAVFKKSLIK